MNEQLIGRKVIHIYVDMDDKYKVRYIRINVRGDKGLSIIQNQLPCSQLVDRNSSWHLLCEMGENTVITEEYDTISLFSISLT